MMERNDWPQYVWQVLNILLPKKESLSKVEPLDSAQIPTPIKMNLIPIKKRPSTREEMEKIQEEVERMERISDSSIDEVLHSK